MKMRNKKSHLKQEKGKRYFVINLLNEDELIGPFNTQIRAKTYKKKHHIYGWIHEEKVVNLH